VTHVTCLMSSWPIGRCALHCLCLARRPRTYRFHAAGLARELDSRHLLAGIVIADAFLTLLALR
jgi:hypothetical protein